MKFGVCVHEQSFAGFVQNQNSGLRYYSKLGFIHEVHMYVEEKIHKSGVCVCVYLGVHQENKESEQEQT